MKFIPKSILYLFTLLALIGFSSCRVTKPIKEETTVTKSEEIVIEKKDITVDIPERTIVTELKLPILQPIRFIEIKNGKQNIVHNHKFNRFSKDSTAIVNGKIDSLGNLFIESTTLSYKYQLQLEVQNKIIKEQTNTIITLEKQLTWIGEKLNRIGVIFIVLLLVLMAISLVLVKFKRLLL